MAILKNREIKDLSNDELNRKLEELKLSLAKERGKIGVGGVAENPGKIGEIRKTVARILTMQHQRKIKKE